MLHAALPPAATTSAFQRGSRSEPINLNDIEDGAGLAALTSARSSSSRPGTADASREQLVGMVRQERAQRLLAEQTATDLREELEEVEEEKDVMHRALRERTDQQKRVERDARLQTVVFRHQREKQQAACSELARRLVEARNEVKLALPPRPQPKAPATASRPATPTPAAPPAEALEQLRNRLLQILSAGGSASTNWTPRPVEQSPSRPPSAGGAGKPPAAPGLVAAVSPTGKVSARAAGTSLIQVPILEAQPLDFDEPQVMHCLESVACGHDAAEEDASTAAPTDCDLSTRASAVEGLCAAEQLAVEVATEAAEVAVATSQPEAAQESAEADERADAAAVASEPEAQPECAEAAEQADAAAVASEPEAAVANWHREAAEECGEADEQAEDAAVASTDVVMEPEAAVANSQPVASADVLMEPEPDAEAVDFAVAAVLSMEPLAEMGMEQETVAEADEGPVATTAPSEAVQSVEAANSAAEVVVEAAPPTAEEAAVVVEESNVQSSRATSARSAAADYWQDYYREASECGDSESEAAAEAELEVEPVSEQAVAASGEAAADHASESEAESDDDSEDSADESSEDESAHSSPRSTSSRASSVRRHVPPPALSTVAESEEVGGSARSGASGRSSSLSSSTAGWAAAVLRPSGASVLDSKAGARPALPRQDSLRHRAQFHPSFQLEEVQPPPQQRRLGRYASDGCMAQRPEKPGPPPSMPFVRPPPVDRPLDSLRTKALDVARSRLLGSGSLEAAAPEQVCSGLGGRQPAPPVAPAAASRHGGQAKLGVYRSDVAWEFERVNLPGRTMKGAPVGIRKEHKMAIVGRGDVKMDSLSGIYKNRAAKQQPASLSRVQSLPSIPFARGHGSCDAQAVQLHGSPNRFMVR